MWFLFAFAALLPRPPVGAVYARRLHLPLVGAQREEALKIIRDSAATRPS